MKTIIVTFVLVVGGGAALFAQATGEVKKPAAAESRPTSSPATPRPSPPLSTAGEKVTPELTKTAVFVELAHRTDDADDRACLEKTTGVESCRVKDHWQVVLDRKRVLRAAPPDRRFDGALRELAAAGETEAPQRGPKVTDRPVIFGFDRRAPYGISAALIAAAATARFHYLYFLVRPDANATTATAIRCDLPVDGTPRAEGDVWRLLAAYDSEHDALDRLLVRDDKSEGAPIPDGADGDEKLMKELRAHAAKNAAGAEPSLIIDVGAFVSWQILIDLFSAGRTAGFKDIELAAPAEKPARKASR